MGVSCFSMATHFEPHEGERLKDNVIQSAKAIDDCMFTRVKDFNFLSNNPLFNMSSSEIISDYLSRVVEQHPLYEDVLIANKNVIITS